jgi:hypothetical protein
MHLRVEIRERASGTKAEANVILVDDFPVARRI